MSFILSQIGTLPAYDLFMKTQTILKTLIFSLSLTTIIQTANASCFNPRHDPVLQEVLRPQARYHETQNTIEIIHELIWSVHNEIDPRLIYHRLVGESGGRPHIVNPSSGAYGLFQFLGRPYRSAVTHRQIVEQLERENPNISPRLIQVRYYIEHYLRDAINAADQGYGGRGCPRNQNFSEYSNLQKVAYLGWGSCTQRALQQELALCENVASYRQACTFSREVIADDGEEPLCND